MAILEGEIYCYGSLQMAEDDTTLAIGSGIDTATAISFQDLTSTRINGNIGVVASTSTTSGVTVYGRDSSGALINETITMNGTTPVYATGYVSWNRLLKATRPSQQLNVAVISSGVVTNGTLQAGGTNPNQVTLAAGASATDNAYQFCVLRVTGGAAAGAIGVITSYVGSTKVANVWPALSGTVGTDTYSIHEGMFFPSHPSIVTTVRRPFYNASADVASGSQRTYYDKVFLRNNNPSGLALTSAVISEYSDPTGNVTFALESGLNGVGTNGSNNRQTAPTTGVTAFNSSNKNVSNSQNHTASGAQGVWLCLTLAAGAAATNSYYILRETGQSI